jgi:hypothetical protein
MAQPEFLEKFHKLHKSVFVSMVSLRGVEVELHPSLRTALAQYPQHLFSNTRIYLPYRGTPSLQNYRQWVIPNKHHQFNSYRIENIRLLHYKV